jgi:hypothetical protein
VDGLQELRRRKGWGKKGKPVEISSLFSDTKSYTLLAAMGVDGFIVPACQLTDEIQDADKVVEWFRVFLLPYLGDFRRGDALSVVLMDNDHKV